MVSPMALNLNPARTYQAFLVCRSAAAGFNHASLERGRLTTFPPFCELAQRMCRCVGMSYSKVQFVAYRSTAIDWNVRPEGVHRPGVLFPRQQRYLHGRELIQRRRGGPQSELDTWRPGKCGAGRALERLAVRVRHVDGRCGAVSPTRSHRSEDWPARPQTQGQDDRLAEHRLWCRRAAAPTRPNGRQKPSPSSRSI